MLKKIAKRLVIQGPHHADNIATYYEIMAETAKDTFTEDNVHTLNDFLVEQHQKSLLVVEKRTVFSTTTTKNKSHPGRVISRVIRQP